MEVKVILKQPKKLIFQTMRRVSIALIVQLIFSCNSDKSKHSDFTSESNVSQTENPNISSERNSAGERYKDEWDEGHEETSVEDANEDDSDEEDEESESSKNGSCDLEDGVHRAVVEYSNSETMYFHTYTLDVIVSDCQVVQMNFPKGGWLDSDHISVADIDDDGNATIDGEKGKSYIVHIVK